MIRHTTSSSSVPRRVLCPGSHRAEEGLPEEDSEWSEQGTRLHKLFELSDTEFLALTPEAANCTEQEFWLVRNARYRADEVMIRVIAELAIDPSTPFEEGVERELWLRDGLKKVMPGHCDRWRFYPSLGLIVIIDAKFGFNVVTAAPSNLQLRTYAVQAADEPCWDVQTACVAIVQPRADEEHQMTLAIYDAEALRIARAQLHDWRKAWLQPDAPRFASDEACRYCKAKLLCDVYRARLSPANVVRDSAGVLASLPQMGEAEFSRFFVAVKMARADEIWEKLNSEARIRVAAGRMPGFTLEENSPRNAIIDDREAARLAYELVGFEGVKSLALGDLAKLLNRKRKEIGEKSTEKACKEIIAETFRNVTEKRAVKPSVVGSVPAALT